MKADLESDDSWLRWKAHILSELHRLSRVNDEQTRMMRKISDDVIILKTKAGVVGGVIGGVLGATLQFVVAVLMKKSGL